MSAPWAPLRLSGRPDAGPSVDPYGGRPSAGAWVVNRVRPVHRVVWKHLTPEAG
jgi:hypothetical protein